MQEDQFIAYASRQRSYRGICVIVLEIVIVREGSPYSMGSLESDIYLHSLKIALGQCR